MIEIVIMTIAILITGFFYYFLFKIMRYIWRIIRDDEIQRKNQWREEALYYEYMDAEQELEDLEADINNKANTDWSKEP